MLESIEETQAEYGEKLVTGYCEVVAVMDLGPEKIEEMSAEDLAEGAGLTERDAYKLKRVVRIATKHT